MVDAGQTPVDHCGGGSMGCRPDEGVGGAIIVAGVVVGPGQAEKAPGLGLVMLDATHDGLLLLGMGASERLAFTSMYRIYRIDLAVGMAPLSFGFYR